LEVLADLTSEWLCMTTNYIVVRLPHGWMDQHNILSWLMVLGMSPQHLEGLVWKTNIPQPVSHGRILHQFTLTDFALYWFYVDHWTNRKLSELICMLYIMLLTVGSLLLWNLSMAVFRMEVCHHPSCWRWQMLLVIWSCLQKLNACKNFMFYSSYKMQCS